MLRSKLWAVGALSVLVSLSLAAAGCRYARTEGRNPSVESRASRGGPAQVTLTPEVSVDPVKTQHVFVATVTDAAGNPLPGVDVEWILTRSAQQSSGYIIDVDGGQKIDNAYARSTTGRSSYTISRGTANPSDDVRVGPGQTWCMVKSGEEGV